MKWLIPIGLVACTGALLSISLLAWLRHDPSELYKAAVPVLVLLLLWMRKKKA